MPDDATNGIISRQMAFGWRSDGVEITFFWHEQIFPCTRNFAPSCFSSYHPIYSSISSHLFCCCLLSLFFSLFAVIAWSLKTASTGRSVYLSKYQSEHHMSFSLAFFGHTTRNTFRSLGQLFQVVLNLRGSRIHVCYGLVKRHKACHIIRTTLLFSDVVVHFITFFSLCGTAYRNSLWSMNIDYDKIPTLSILFLYTTDRVLSIASNGIWKREITEKQHWISTERLRGKVNQYTIME